MADSFIGRGNHNTQQNIVDPLSMFRTHKCKWWKAYDIECSELTNVSGERHMIVTRRHLIATMGIRQTRSAGIINEIFGCVFQLTVGIAMGNNCALLIAGLFRKDYSYEVDFMQEFLKKNDRKLGWSFNFVFLYMIMSFGSEWVIVV